MSPGRELLGAWALGLALTLTQDLERQASRGVRLTRAVAFGLMVGLLAVALTELLA